MHMFENCISLTEFFPLLSLLTSDPPPSLINMMFFEVYFDFDFFQLWLHLTYIWLTNTVLITTAIFWVIIYKPDNQITQFKRSCRRERLKNYLLCFVITRKIMINRCSFISVLTITMFLVMLLNLFFTSIVLRHLQKWLFVFALKCVDRDFCYQL